MKLNSNFYDLEFLKSKYVQRYEQAYQQTINTPLFNYYRNYEVLLDSLNSIYKYNNKHANTFIKRIMDQEKNFRSCEAIFSEIIVYAYYLKQVKKENLKSLDIQEKDYDLRIEITDGSYYYLEILCIMPDILLSRKEDIKEDIRIQTHLQDSCFSIRQKLLDKIVKQKQLTKPRNNLVVIELNDIRIAGDFHVLSSLSAGYKIYNNSETSKNIGEGFDWSNSIFNNEILRYVMGIIYFSLGNYNQRKFIPNPNFNLG